MRRLDSYPENTQKYNAKQLQTNKVKTLKNELVLFNSWMRMYLNKIESNQSITWMDRCSLDFVYPSDFDSRY